MEDQFKHGSIYVNAVVFVENLNNKQWCAVERDQLCVQATAAIKHNF